MKTVAYRHKQLVYSSTHTRDISHFTPLPMGEGSGEGPVGAVDLFCCFAVLYFSFLQQTLSKYRVLNILLVFEYEAGNDSTQ